MMQEDEEIGKIASQVPSMIARASEVFVMHMILVGAEIARTRSAKTLSASHMCVPIPIISPSFSHSLTDSVPVTQFHAV
jgi:hypothetical protein